jgi:uncharacterized membrane protein
MSHNYEHPHASALEKEFELERVILFSDAVFAIAITLLIIDIKWPEFGATVNKGQMAKLFVPTILGFIAFALSFWYIGRSWSVHLRLFRMVRRYDQGLINRNLLFLFFIVTFPFTASGISGHLRVGFLMPEYLYIGNIALSSLMHLNLVYYLFRKRKTLVVEGQEPEKKFFYKRALYQSIAMCVALVLIILAAQWFGDNENFPAFSFGGMAVALGLAKRASAKYRPMQTPD